MPKPQTVKLGDSEFFIDPKLLVIARIFPQCSINSVNCYFSHWKKVHYFTEVHYLQYLEVLYIQVRLYYAFVWPI